MPNHPQASITIALRQPLMVALTQMATEANTTEDALIQRAIEGLVQARLGPGIPRFARRLGPIALATSAAHLKNYAGGQPHADSPDRSARLDSNGLP
jgi:hypothetical protein